MHSLWICICTFTGANPCVSLFCSIYLVLKLCSKNLHQLQVINISGCRIWGYYSGSYKEFCLCLLPASCWIFFLGGRGVWLVIFIDHEDGGDMFLQNAGCFQWTTWCYIPEDIILQYFRLFLRKLIRNNLLVSLCLLCNSLNTSDQKYLAKIVT
jgi:hypothetical protein